MKKLLTGAMVTLFLIFASCSSSNDDDMSGEGTMEDDDPMVMPMARNYEDDVKPLIESNCLSCHSNPPVNNAPMSLVTFDDVKNAVETRSLLARINSSTSPMPPQGRLPAATRQIIEDWIDQGLPEN